MTESNTNARMSMIGCLFLMFAIASYGLSLSTIQGPILDSLNGAAYFALVTLLSSIGMCVMTPVGGRLTDMMPIDKLLLYSGGVSIVAGLGMTFIPNLWVFIICRVLLALSQGIYASLPFIIVRKIYPPQQTPKAMGYLAMITAVGGLLGSFLAGWLADMGYMKMAIAFPLIALAAGIFLICKFFYEEPTQEFSLDYACIILLTIALSGLLLGLNNGPTDGWFSRFVIFSFAAGITGLLAFIYWENKAKMPIIPMQMLKIKEYSLLLIIGFCLMFYMNAMNVYMPLAVQHILNEGSAAAGALQTPKTIVTMIAPALAGAWVMKKTGNLWKALFYAALLVAIPFAFLIFTGVHMPLWAIMTLLAITGISDSLRTVALIPAAQSFLKPEEMGIGTSLIGFITTLSSSISAAFFGLAYNSLTKEVPGLKGEINGIDTICLMTCVISFVAALLVILFFRPMLEAKIKEKAQAAKTAAAK